LALVNTKKREVQAKIVYYGPARGGKTTNLEYVNKTMDQKVKSKLINIKTYGDRTLFFDFLPLGIGQIQGYDIVVQLYTVPGQVKYNSTRRLVLRGVDGVVFVADSMKLRRRDNLLALKNLQENLVGYQKDIFKIPLVLQYNKRDLEGTGVDLLPVDVMDRELNGKLKTTAMTASATTGDNVLATLRKIIYLTVNSLRDKLQ
jgi:signal recognition particle receptor subunit beta